MANAGIWWDRADRETPSLISGLGGKAVVETAVAAVLPDRRVKLRAMTPGISGGVVFRASPQRQFSDGRRVSEVDGVLKVGPARLLADEMDRYDKWVAHILTQSSHFPPLDALRDLGAVAVERPDEIHALHYRHVGHVSFGDRFRELSDSGDIEGVCRLTDSLLAVLRPWQEIVDPIGSESLTSDGVYSFVTNPFDEFEQTCARLNRHGRVPADVIDRDLYVSVRQLWARDALSSERQLQSIVHGDLHVDNVLVSGDDTVTLIDFGATGEGHFLRDLSTLEAHLVLRTMSPPGRSVTDVQRAYLAGVASLYQPSALLNPSPDLDVTPLHAAVLRLRRYALYCLMRGETGYVPQYAIAVLRNAVRICTRRDESFTDAQRWTAAKVSTMLRDALVVDNHRLAIRGAAWIGGASRFSFLGLSARPATKPYPLRPPKVDPCTMDTWRALARTLRVGRRVDVVGIAPSQLISAALGVWSDEEFASVPMPRLRYVTIPPPRGTSTGGSVALNWRPALIGMRNIANVVTKTHLPIDRFAGADSGVTTNCLVRVDGAADVNTIYLLGQVSSPGVIENAYVLSEVSDTDGQVSDMMDAAFARAQPITIREVDCLPMADPPTDALPYLVAQQAFRLAAYGDPTPRSACLRPVALTILRAKGPGGRQVIVKMRSPLADLDDFGRLSFLSARILADDVAQAYGTIMPVAEDAEDAFDTLWERIGSPDPFVLSEEVFVQAAMRDVYETTLLKLTSDRFTSRGFHVFARDDGHVQLGFAVLTVDLAPAEVSAARRACQAMRGSNGDLLRVMRVRDLLSGEHPVNRIMRMRRDWLLTHCLGPDVD